METRRRGATGAELSRQGTSLSNICPARIFLLPVGICPAYGGLARKDIGTIIALIIKMIILWQEETMRNIAAKEAKTHFGALLDSAQREPITIQKHGRAVAVVLSAQEYNDMKRAQLRAELAVGEAQADRGQFAEDYSLEGLINELDKEVKSS